MSSVLYILWEPDCPRTFANRAEAFDAALAAKDHVRGNIVRLYSFDPKTSAWHILVVKGQPVAGEPWVPGVDLPLRLWLMGNQHQRSGQ